MDVYSQLTREHGLSLDDAAIQDEIAADFTETLLDDAALFERFARENRSTAQKLLDALQEFIAKVRATLTGRSRDAAAREAYDREFGELEAIAEKWQAAFDAAAEQAKNAETATEDGGGSVVYSLKDSNDSGVISIKQQISAASDALNKADPVVIKNIPDQFDRMNIKQKRKWAESQALMYGAQIDRKGYGRIYVSNKDINSALNYLKDDGEIAAFSALPAVLKRGVEVYRENDHKGRGYSTVTFAAPVVINSVRGNMAVVVRETSKNHYDMHRIVMPDGTAFAFKNERNAESGPTTATPNNGALTQPTDSASESTIPVNGKDVKGKFSLKNAPAIDSAGRELSEQQEEYFKDSKVRDAEGRLLNIDGFYPNLDKMPANIVPTKKNIEAYKAGAHFREAYGEESVGAWNMFFENDPELAEEVAFYNSANQRYYNAGMRGDPPKYRLAVRFGDLPSNGRSRNWGTRELERGVSVVDFLNDKTQSGRSLYDDIYGIQGTEKNIVGGWDFGIFGSDGEPLLINPVIIAPMSEINRIKRVDNVAPTNDPDIIFLLFQ